MRAARVLAVARKNLRALKHDRRTVAFLVLMPLLMITIFGYTFGGNVEDLRVYIVDLDTAPTNESVSHAIIADLRTRETVKIVHILGPDVPEAIERAREQVRQTRIWAAIVFGTNFSQEVSAVVSSGKGEPVPIRVIADGTNPNIVAAITADLQKAIGNVLGAHAFSAPIAVSTELVYGEGAEFIDFFAPGVMGLAAMMVTFILSIISFVHERAASTLDRLLSTPVTEGEVVAGYALAFGLVGLIQSTVILLAAVLLFRIQILGSPLVVLLVIFLLGIGHQGLGFLLSSFARSEFQAIQFLPLILFPSLLLSGVFWPVEAVPELLRPVSYIVPLTYAVEGMRSVMVRGWGLVDIWLELGVLVLFACLTLSASVLGLRRRG